MGVWARSFLVRPAGSLTAEGAAAAVSGRLLLLSSLLCPEQEEPVPVVLGRLAVTADGKDAIAVRYRSTSELGLRFERWRGEDARQEVGEVLSSLSAGENPARIREAIAGAVEVVGVRLSQHDLDGMGLPVAVAYLSSLAAEHGGLIQVEDRGWFAPTANEVRLLHGE
jgi:hypothetical protein